MKHVRLGRLAVLATAVVLAAPGVAQGANEVTKWNEIAVTTVSGQPPITSAPPAASVFVAMVQGAVYGAVNAIDRHGKPYLVYKRFPKASKDAAVATAAFRVLDSLFSATHGATLLTAYNESLAAIPDGKRKDEGIRAGEKAAARMLAEGHDSRAVIGCTFGSGLPGVWQPLADPLGMPVCDPSPWVANAKTFVVKSASQFRTAGPVPIDSAAYAGEVEEVEAIGSLTSTTRSPAQTHAAAFWQTNGAANYNAIARRFVDQFSLNVSESARLFAMLDLSAADALINTWNDKYYWNWWRPITAIRHPDDGNPATDSDPSWTPLFSAGFPTSPPLPPDPLPIGGVGGPLSTPPYPDHPSGATAYASASMAALASFFRTDNLTFYATSGRFPGELRTFNRFSDVTNEVLEARIWAGIHFRAADVQAASLGRKVERYIHKHLFRGPKKGG